MNAADTPRPIRHIVVAVDASPDSDAALEAAAELAATLEAEIEALFVEEEDLLRLERLSFAKELSVFSTSPRPLGGRDVQRQLRTVARRLQRRLQEVARHAQVPWSFRTARGRVAGELERAARNADLLVLGSSGRSVKRGPGSTAMKLLLDPPAPVMVLRHASRMGVGVHLLHDGSPEARRALELASLLAGRETPGLTVYLATDDEREGEEMARGIGRQLAEWGLQPDFHRLSRTGPARLAALLHTRRCGLFVAPQSGVLGEQEMLRELLARADCPVLLVG